MPDEQENGDHKAARPHLQVEISSNRTEGIQDGHHQAQCLLDSNAADEEKTIRSMSPSSGNKTATAWSVESLLSTLRWIPANWNWSKWKPVLRSALAAWICLLLFLIPASLNVMGQAGFLIIVASFFSPPSDPFVSVLQRELGILLFAALGWAWSCLGIKLADLARSNRDPTATSANIFSGHYMEAAPSIIMAVFLFIGSFAFLYIKSRVGPGPLILATIFGCICIDICLTTAVMYPYPYYTIGQYILLPLSFHSAVALVLSLILFPTSESSVFATRLQTVLTAVLCATKEHCNCLQQDVTAPGFTTAPIVTAISKAEGAFGILASAAHLQKLDILYSRFSPTDFNEIYSITRRLIPGAGGMALYYTLIDPTREKFPVTPIPSAPATPTHTSPPHSRPPSPIRELHQALSRDAAKPKDAETLDGGMDSHHPPHHHHSHPKVHHHNAHHHRKRHHVFRTVPHHSAHSHSSLLHIALSRAARKESDVGVFESLRYLNLEATYLSQPDSEAHVARAKELLSFSCQDLLKNCANGLQGAQEWLGSAPESFFHLWLSREDRDQIRTSRIKKYEDLHRALTLTLNEFISKKRLAVLDPYRAMVTSSDSPVAEREVIPHRHLFHCYVYQFHLMRFAANIQHMLGEIIRLETEREVSRLWLPKMPWSKLVHQESWEPSEIVEKDDDENPDIIPGLDPTSQMDLGRAVRRDPDALPPRNALEKTTNWVYYAATQLGGGNVLFAFKAGILSILLTLPSYFKSSAEFAYKNKFVWAVIMGQLTIARFRGDTALGLFTRIFSTFVGGIIGMVMWYISAGSGLGNPFGLAAVCFVCFPVIFFFHLYWPVPPMTNFIIWVTVALVIGYSYQDTHVATVSSQGYGFAVAWRRFLLVTIGVVAAGIFSFFPPATTIRLYQRKTLATTSAEIGSTYCSVISFAHTKKEGESPVILQHILAILSKLQRTLMLKQNIVYEVSLRGKWPAERYQRVLELQMQISKLLSHLMSALEKMEPAWAHAFLRRTQLSNADFQGDVLAVMTLISTSLRTGDPLPQVTPCPLLNRFLEQHHGLNVIHEESEEDFGLPKVLTEETLESLQYMIFCVGVSTAYGIVVRLDKLMVAVKELVGEQYHIDGVGLPSYHRRRAQKVGMRSVPTV